jgi:parallel beta-helix repeat protein
VSLRRCIGNRQNLQTPIAGGDLYCDKGKLGQSQGRKATGPRFLRDAFCDATKDPKIAELPPKVRVHCTNSQEAIMDRQHLLAIVSGLALLVTAGSARPEPMTLSVDCSAGQSITNALQRGDARKPLLVYIKGTCTEFVAIERDKVKLVGVPDSGAAIEAPGVSGDVIRIEGNDITLENLTVQGGRYGIRQSHGVRVMIDNCVIQDTENDGVHAWVGDTRLQETTIQRAGGHGLSINRGATATVGDSYLLDNQGSGIFAQQNAAVIANNNEIQRNANGVMLHSASHGDFSGNDISANTENGVLIQAGSTANIDNNEVLDNQGDGVVGYLGATLVLHGNNVTGNSGSGLVGNAHSTVQVGGAHIANNVGDGIVMMLGSKLILEEPATEVFTNGNFGVWCGDDESSLNEPVLLNTWGNVAGEIECTGF